MVNYSKDPEYGDFIACQPQVVKRDTTKPFAAVRDDDWKSLANSITYLFHKKQLQKLELDILNEKVRNVQSSRMPENIVDCYKDSILKKGMIVLREAIKEKKGKELLDRLGEVWSSFYKNILPMILAIFYPIQVQSKEFRTVTLVGFRDMVLLKTKVADALEPGCKSSPEIKQMLLVLASVREECTPPSENYLRLEQLVARVVSPYLGTNGLCVPDNMAFAKRNSSDSKSSNGLSRERKLSVSMLKEEVTRKFRRSGSLTHSSNNNTDVTNNNKESSFKRRFKVSDSTPKSSAASEVSELSKATVDDEMLQYLEERKQRWKNRDEMLISESLIG